MDIVDRKAIRDFLEDADECLERYQETTKTEIVADGELRCMDHLAEAIKAHGIALRKIMEQL